MNPLANPALTHPILPFLPEPKITALAKISLLQLDKLDNWCKAYDSHLIPGYEGPFSDGIGVAIYIPEDQDTKRFADCLFQDLGIAGLIPGFTGELILHMVQTFITVANKDRWIVFPRLLVTI